MLPKQLASGIIVLVTIVWCINFFAQFLIPTYHPDVTLNGVFLSLVGGAFALSRKEKDTNDKNGDGSGKS